MPEPPQQCPLCGADLLVDEVGMAEQGMNHHDIPWQQWVFYCEGADEHIFDSGQIAQHLPPETVQTMTPTRRALFQEVATKVAQGKGKLKASPEATQALLDYLIELERIACTVQLDGHDPEVVKHLAERIDQLPIPSDTRPFPRPV